MPTNLGIKTARSITVTISVSANGFTWSPHTEPAEAGKIDIHAGDALDLKPARPNPPSSVTVTAPHAGDDAADLFGTATPSVPTHHVVTIGSGIFVLTSGSHTVMVRVSPGAGIDPSPMPQPGKP
jgi:hypothetical protein